MTEAAKILQMIETVSVNDTAMLDEIDARVACFFAGAEYKSHHVNVGYIINRVAFLKDGSQLSFAEYTRSRDALKAIRPASWWFSTSQYAQWFHAVATWSGNPEDVVLTSAKTFGSGKANKTEELAELHAVIQAIEYERTHD